MVDSEPARRRRLVLRRLMRWARYSQTKRPPAPEDLGVALLARDLISISILTFLCLGQIEFSSNSGEGGCNHAARWPRPALRTCSRPLRASGRQALSQFATAQGSRLRWTSGSVTWSR